MNYWLFDFELTEDWVRFWTDLWGEGDLKMMGLPRSRFRPVNWIRGSRMALRESGRDDIIFCWFDFQAIVCRLIAGLTFRRRYIVALNVMCKFHSSLRGRVYQRLYKAALSSPRFHATVTSREYGAYLNRMLGLDIEYELIHDAFLDKYTVAAEDRIEPIPNSVFMGGGSSRDWDFAFRLAEEMPDVTFLFVMPEDRYHRYKTGIRPNIILKYDIPTKEFARLTCAASMEIMPVDTEAPAGLQTMYFAAANDVFYMTTRTAASSEYVTNDRGCILPKDVTAWTENIRYYLAHGDEALEKARRLHRFIETECSCEAFAAGMKRVRDKILSV